MDWSRAKTYLILAFLVLDLLLGYQYYSAQQQAQEYVQSYTSQLQELKDVLKEHKMSLQTDVPKETPVMGFLKASHPKESSRSIISKLLHNTQIIEDDRSKGQMKVHAQEGDFSVTGDGYFTMTYAAPLKTAEMENSPKLGSYALQAVSPTVWNSAKYREDIVNRDRTVAWYVQYYQKYPIFSALLEVHLQNSEIIGYNQKALEVGTEEEGGQKVLSALNAVRSVAESLDPKTVSSGDVIAIKDIKIGYYSQNYEDANVWYLAPMWRIVTDQKVYYVNAFTGLVEKGSP